MIAALQTSSKQRYHDVVAELMKTHGIANRLAAPRITKVALSMGVGRAVADGQILGIVADHLSLLAGQRAQITKTKKSIANWRTRIGMKIGARVTLRGERMWSFIDKLIHLAIPRIKDFRGISPKGFDAFGNFNLGLREQALFPEVMLDKLDHNQGLNITLVIEHSNPTLSLELLRGLGMPFRAK